MERWAVPTLHDDDMPQYKRVYDRCVYFFTAVTYKRRRFLCDETARNILRETITDVRAQRLGIQLVSSFGE
jgi:REP element-mobilizing transposase RayT